MKLNYWPHLVFVSDILGQGDRTPPAFAIESVASAPIVLTILPSTKAYLFMLYDLTVTQFSKMLNNLNAILDKAASFADSKKIDMEVLLNSRLAADQFPLTRQVQIACDTAKLGVARLTDKVESAPKHADTETTLGELQERIKEVIAYLEQFTPEDFANADSVKVSQARWEGKYLTGTEFAIQHAIPNIYFHITTAYAILRHNGVPVGKKDYLGAMPYKI